MVDVRDVDLDTQRTRRRIDRFRGSRDLALKALLVITAVTSGAMSCVATLCGAWTKMRIGSSFESW